VAGHHKGWDDVSACLFLPQAAIKAQIEEKERLKREEREKKWREEAEEERKLKAERDALQKQLEVEDSKNRQKEVG